MDTYEAIMARRTVHLYRESEIDPMLLHKALEAALAAPNHKFTFPWKFVIAGPETREALKAIAKDLKVKKQATPLSTEADARLEHKLTQKIIRPATMVAFCCPLCDDPFRQREDYATVSCGIQNFSVYLAAEGYGTKWSSGGVTTDPRSYEALNVNPETHEIVAFMWVGHTAEPLPTQRRPPLDDVLTTLP